MQLVAAAVRGVFPERYRRDPNHPGQLVPPVPRPASPEAMRRLDPSEAADSERIVAAVREVFPDAWIQPTGGVVYHLALSDMLANFDESAEQDRLLLDLLMLLDDLCVAIGENHYAVALAVKP